jgi:hypothetical protein
MKLGYRRPRVSQLLHICPSHAISLGWHFLARARDRCGYLGRSIIQTVGGRRCDRWPVAAAGTASTTSGSTRASTSAHGMRERCRAEHRGSKQDGSEYPQHVFLQACLTLRGPLCDIAATTSTAEISLRIKPKSSNY